MNNKIKEILIAHGFEITQDDFSDKHHFGASKYLVGIIKKKNQTLDARLQLGTMLNFYIEYVDNSTNWTDQKMKFFLTDDDLPKVTEVIEEFLKKFGEEK